VKKENRQRYIFKPNFPYYNMGWLDVDSKKKEQHTQVIATGNIKDVDRIQQRERKRRWFIFLDIILVVCTLIGIGFIYTKDYLTGVIFIIIGLIILGYLILRKRRKRFSKPRRPQRNRNFRGNSKNRRSRR